jgi:hypothetical protein
MIRNAGTPPSAMPGRGLERRDLRSRQRQHRQRLLGVLVAVLLGTAIALAALGLGCAS